MQPTTTMTMDAAATSAVPSQRKAVTTVAFTALNGLRVFAYLPTLLAIHASGHADQHSLFTWITFCGANLTMALWLVEQHGRIDKAVAVNALNALMCGVIAGLIGWTRLFA
jgi:hypothetical protein